MVICEYCGTETPSISETCICSNCECLASTRRLLLANRDHLLLESLDSIKNLAFDSKYAEAISIYDKLISERKDPFLMYAEALLYIRYSNYELSKITYDKRGFMDENTLSRNSASKLISSSKKLLERAISTIELEISKGNKSANMFYLLFLCQLKMQNYRAARPNLEILKMIPDDYLYSYASMIFNMHIQDYKSAAAFAEKLISKENFSINSLYYTAFMKFKQRDFAEAKKLLDGLNQLIPNKNVELLLSEIR